MSLRKETPCDFGPCPYDAQYHSTCEFYCGADEPADIPDEEFYDEDFESQDWEDDVDECGYNPYMGCYDFDC